MYYYKIGNCVLQKKKNLERYVIVHCIIFGERIFKSLRLFVIEFQQKKKKPILTESVINMCTFYPEIQPLKGNSRIHFVLKIRK